MRTIRTVMTAVIVTTIVSFTMSALAALPTKFRWDNVDGKCYVTPVKTQTGSTDRSYAYSMMDYLETLQLIKMDRDYNSLTEEERKRIIGPVEWAADNAEGQLGAFGGIWHDEVPVMEKSLDWMLREGLNGCRVTDLTFPVKACHMDVIGNAYWLKSMNTAKELLKTNGPFAVGYLHVDDYMNDGRYYYLPARNSFYKYTDEAEHHRTALVIGYDDTVPASVFATSVEYATRPAGPGAWIIKGNRGESYGDNGYYYVSYYDISFLGYTYRLDALSLSSPFELDAKVIDVDWERKYGGVYSHDMSTPSGYWGGTLNGGGSSGFVNMFEAKEPGVVNAIGLWLECVSGGTNIWVSTYVGCEEGKPFTGRCVFKYARGWFPSSGYHVLSLPESLQFNVEKGQRFSVVLEHGPNYDYRNSGQDLTYAIMFQTMDEPVPGRSFWWNYSPDELYDLADEKNKPNTANYQGGRITPNMCFITAYTRNDRKEITLHASDGEVEEGIAINWTFTKNGTYDLYRGEQGGSLSCIARGLTAHIYVDKVNKDETNKDVKSIELDKWYDYKVVDTTNDIESNIDSGIVGTKPVLEEVRVAKLWLEQDPPYKVQLKWNRYNTRIFQVEEGDFALAGIKNTARHYYSQVAKIGKSDDEIVINLAVGNPALNIDYGGHGDYNMSVDWKYTNLESGQKKAGNSVKDVEAKVYFHKYDRPADNISNWYIFWPKDEALDITAARLMKQMKPEIWIENAPSQFDGSFYFNPASISSLGGTFKKLKGIRKADSRWILASEGGMSKYWALAKRKLGLEGDDKVYVWEVEPQLQYFLTDGAAAHGDTISSSVGGYAGKPVGSGTEGLPCVADVMVHEMMHGWLFKNLYSGNLCIGRLGRDGWLQKNDHEPEINWSDWVLRNAPDGPNSFLMDIKGNWALDSDGDGVSDIYEMNFPELSINNRDTLNVKSHHSSYARYGDNEYLARREEIRHEWNRVAVHAENDWAFPGSKIAKDYESYTLGSWKNARKSVKESLQNDFSSDTSTRAYARLANANVPNDDEDSHVSGSLKAFYRPTICEFIFDVLEIVSVGEGVAQKTEDGGPYTSLSFPVSVTNMTDSDESCVLRGYLLDGQSNAVAWASSVLDVSAGTVAVGSLVFDAEHLYSGENKDISLAWVAVEPLGDEFGAVFDITNAMARTELAYRLDEFAPPPARIDVQHISEEMDEKGLAIIVPVENFTADDLRVVATISGTNGQYVASASTNIAQGASLARLDFPKAQLAYSRIHGPYVVSSVQVLRGSESVCGKMNVYVTREYDESAILPENPVIIIKEDSFARVAAQRSGEIAFAFSVSNCTAEAVSYRTKAFMFATNGTFVCSSITNVVLESGGNNVRISFDVKDIPDSAVEPYWVREVILDPVGDVGMRDHFYPVPYYFDTAPITPLVVFCEGVSSGFEGNVATIRISGGNVDKMSSVDVYLSYNTATSADVDLAKGMIDGVTPKGGLKFPLTLTWAAGKVGEKVIEIPIKIDKAVEGDEFFTLQLANPAEVVVGDASVCTVTIKDANTYATLQDGIRNPGIKVTTSGVGKWDVGAGSAYNQDGTLGLYHVESPTLEKGESSTLSFGAVKGTGSFVFYLRFTGDPNEAIPSSLAVYNGKNLLGTVSHAQVDDVWRKWNIDESGAPSNSTHNYNFVFTQGSDPNVHAEVSDILWDDGNTTLVYNVWACTDGNGGYASGSGPYLEGQTAKITAKPLPGWTFDGWYRRKTDSETGEIIYGLWNSSATVSYKVSAGLYVTAFFTKIPYVRGLADPADGGKVSGSGLCAAGKKVTLKATANKGFVFTGWVAGTQDAYQDRLTPGAVEYIATTPTLVIDRSAKPTKDSATSTSITNVTGDASYYACFITSDEDKAAVIASVNGWTLEPWVSKTETHAFATNIWAGVYVEWPVATSALSEPKVKVAGLPAGLKFTDKPVTSKIGSGKTAVMVTNILANTIYGAPTAASKIGKDGNPTPSAVKLTVTTAGKSSQTYQIDTVVDALPAWAVGTFDGHAGRVTLPGDGDSGTGGDDGRDGARPSQGDENALAARSASGVVSLAIAANGKISGKLLEEGLTWTLSAPWFDEARLAGDGSPHQDTEAGSPVFVATVIGKSGKQELTNEVAVAADEARSASGPYQRGVVAARSPSGPYQDMEWEAYQNLWKAEPWKTFGKSLDKNVLAYAILADGTFSEDEEVLTSALGADVTGRVTVKLAASGAANVAGEFVAGYNEKTKKHTTVKATGSATLVPVDETHGVVFIYLTPKGLDPHVRCVGVPWPHE